MFHVEHQGCAAASPIAAGSLNWGEVSGARMAEHRICASQLEGRRFLSSRWTGMRRGHSVRKRCMVPLDTVESPAVLKGAGGAGTSRDDPLATKPTK